MNTFIFLVRYGDSPKTVDEITRGLAEKGEIDVQRITDKVAKLSIEVNPR